jgi:Skp family chaperone for outer membrane proteins
MNTFKMLSLSLALVCASGLAAASDQPSAAAAQATAAPASEGPETVAGILSTQRELREHLDKRDGEYARYSDESVRKMERAQDQVFSMLTGVDSLDQLNDGDRIKLSNALDEVKSVLLAKEDSRLICHLERKIGSNMMQRRCETVAQRQANADEARRQMDHNEIGR